MKLENSIVNKTALYNVKRKYVGLKNTKYERKQKFTNKYKNNKKQKKRKCLNTIKII